MSWFKTSFADKRKMVKNRRKNRNIMDRWIKRDTSGSMDELKKAWNYGIKHSVSILCEDRGILHRKKPFQDKFYNHSKVSYITKSGKIYQITIEEVIDGKTSEDYR